MQKLISIITVLVVMAIIALVAIIAMRMLTPSVQLGGAKDQLEEENTADNEADKEADKEADNEADNDTERLVNENKKGQETNQKLSTLNDKLSKKGDLAEQDHQEIIAVADKVATQSNNVSKISTKEKGNSNRDKALALNELLYQTNKLVENNKTLLDQLKAQLVNINASNSDLSNSLAAINGNHQVANQLSKETINKIEQTLKTCPPCPVLRTWGVDVHEVSNQTVGSIVKDNLPPGTEPSDIEA